jgi:hypothetical protein
MKRIYISGPIEGQSDYVERFAKAEAELYAAGYEICNPVDLYGEMMPGTTKEELIDASLKLLTDCDGIYMLDGWEISTIPSLEYKTAVDLKKMIIFEGGEL